MMAAVMEYLARHASEPVSLKDLRDALEVAPDDRRALRHALAEMEEDGRVQRVTGRRYLLPKKATLVEGRVHRHERGFGFLLDTGLDEDPFLAPETLEGLMQGDRVRARLEPGRNGRSRAVVEKVLNDHARAVGVLRRWGKKWMLEVEGHADGFVVENVDMAGLQDGFAVDAVITGRHEATRRGTCTVKTVLGKSGSMPVEVEKLVAASQAPVDFPEDVLAYVEKVPADVLADAAQDSLRRDITAIPLVTIDGETARDFDDAVHVAVDGQKLVLTVAIADVSHYVVEGSALDESAAERGTSIYFPGRVIPMLPHRLSDNLCSLRPHEPRLCMVAQMHFPKGAALPDHVELFPGLMKSRARLTYTRVHEAVVQGLKTLPEAPGWELEPALALFHRLRKGRMDRGALDLDLPEPEVVINAESEPTGLHESPRYESHQLIEEFMIAANEAVARWFVERNLPCVYRVHEHPDEDKLARFTEMTGAYARGIHLKPNPGPVDISAFLKKLPAGPSTDVLHMQLLRAMMQARYATENLGHYGLASDAYLHFTSPIRRYPDLLVHRELRRALEAAQGKGHKRPKGAVEGQNESRLKKLHQLAEANSRAERRSTDLERQVDALFAARFCQSHVGEEHDAVVTGVAEMGLFMRIKAFGAEALLPMTAMGGRSFTVDEAHGMLLAPRGGQGYRLGDVIKVTIADVSLARRQVTLGLPGVAAVAAEPRGFARAPRPGKPLPRMQASSSHRGAPPPSRGKSDGGRHAPKAKGKGGHGGPGGGRNKGGKGKGKRR